MSYIPQGLPFNHRMVNNELFGNLEQTFCNDLKPSELQTHRKIKFVSSIDHYYSLHSVVPPNYNFPTALTPNLVSPNEIKYAGEFQGLPLNHYLPNDKTQPCGSIPISLVAGSQPPSCYGADEVGFSSLFSLEYSLPDYGDTGLRHFEQFSIEKPIDVRQNFTSLPHQLYFEQSISKEQMSPYFPQAFVQQNLSTQGQLHNLTNDRVNDYSCPSLAEPPCLTSNNWKMDHCINAQHLPESTITNSNSLEKSKSHFESSRSINKSIGKDFSEEHHFVLNPTPKIPSSRVTTKNFNNTPSNIPPESLRSDAFKNEIVGKTESLTSPKTVTKKKGRVSKEKSLKFEVWKEKPTTDTIISDMEANSTLPVEVNNVVKTSSESSSLKDSQTFDVSFTELKPKERENLSNPSVEEYDQKNFSTVQQSATVLSCQPTALDADKNTSQNKQLDIKMCRVTSPVECDSTTESGQQLTNFNKKSAGIRKPSVMFKSEVSDRTTLEMHNETSAKKLMKPSKCRICKEFLVTERPLSQHFTVPIDANYDVCNACNICFLQKSALNTNDGDATNPHKCSFCGRRFKKECYLVLHIRSHTTERLFKCNECGKAFANTSKLKLHLKTHSGDKPFVCKECDRRFVQEAHLKMHSRVHFANKLFHCSSCLKGFASRSRLSEHEKYHNPKLPFKCVTCEKSFVKKIYFESHLRIHCDAKPFECNTCNTFFAQKSILRQHTRHCSNVIISNDPEVQEVKAFLQD